MGRPESPLTGPPNRVALATLLREMRASSGVTYAEMARHPDYRIPEATLKRTASDRGGVPRWHRVEEYRDICIDLAPTAPQWMRTPAGSRGGLIRSWALARREERGTLHLPPPRPKFVADEAELSRALYLLYEYRGAPSLRDLQKLSERAFHLPLTTTARIVKRDTIPADGDQFIAFIRGCGIKGRRATDWIDAWSRVIFKKDSAFEAAITMEEKLNIMSTVGRK